MDQFDRFKLLILDKFDKITSKNVLIIGLGGVGSYATEALVRSGINNLTIVDGDKISITNLNRQLMTNLDNIGNYKTDEIEKRILSINKNCNIKKITQFIDLVNIDLLFENKIDYIIDACDSIKIKEELIRKSIKYNIKLISCMSTGNKMDPTRLKICDIRKTNYDPIAKKIRKMIKDEKINKKVMVVCSDEEKVIKTYKEIPTNSFVPATAGLLCASFVINDIVGD